MVVNFSKNKNISVVGLGKLGSCFAACFAYRGFNVIGLDINKEIVDKLNNGKAPFLETNLQDIINESKRRLMATTNPNDAFDFSDVYFTIVPTPSKNNGSFSNEFIKKALKPFIENLKFSKNFKTFVITSTVSPLSIQSEIIPFIEKVSSKRFNKDFTVIYNPTFIAIGDIIKGILEPDLVLIGESNKKVGNIIENLWRDVVVSKPYFARMSIVSAEITKIAINSYITTKISFANMLGNICEKVHGAEINKITQAIGADRRIGRYYLKYGTAYGGPCFPRDNRAFSYFAKQFGIDALIPKSAHKINEFQSEFLTNKILNILKKYNLKSLSILGLAYKPKTYVIEESASINLIKNFLEKNKNLKIIVYDLMPRAIEETKKLFKDRLIYAKSLKEATKSKVIVVMLPEKSFKNLKSNNKIIIDCWAN